MVPCVAVLRYGVVSVLCVQDHASLQRRIHLSGSLPQSPCNTAQATGITAGSTAARTATWHFAVWIRTRCCLTIGSSTVRCDGLSAKLSVCKCDLYSFPINQFKGQSIHSYCIARSALTKGIRLGIMRGHDRPRGGAPYKCMYNKFKNDISNDGVPFIQGLDGSGSTLYLKRNKALYALTLDRCPIALQFSCQCVRCHYGITPQLVLFSTTRWRAGIGVAPNIVLLKCGRRIASFSSPLSSKSLLRPYRT